MNSCDGMMSGVAMWARLQRRANCAHDCRSSAVRLLTSARHVKWRIGVAFDPWSVRDDGKEASRRRHSADHSTSESAAVFHVEVMAQLYDALGSSVLWSLSSVYGSLPGSRFAEPRDREPRDRADRTMQLHATPRAEHRVCGWRHRIAEPDRWPQREPVAALERRGDDVRQRRQLGSASRRAGRVTSW